MRAHLSGSSRKKGIKSAPVLHELPPLQIDPPTELSEAEAAHWRRLIEAAPAGLLTQADGVALRLLAELLAEKDEMRAEMTASKLQLIRGLLDALGMTPTSRRRLALVAAAAKADDEDEPDPWEGF